MERLGSSECLLCADILPCVIYQIEHCIEDVGLSPMRPQDYRKLMRIGCIMPSDEGLAKGTTDK